VTGWAVALVISGGQRDPGTYVTHEVIDDIFELPQLVKDRGAVEVRAIRMMSASIAQSVFEAAAMKGVLNDDR